MSEEKGIKVKIMLNQQTTPQNGFKENHVLWDLDVPCAEYYEHCNGLTTVKVFKLFAYQEWTAIVTSGMGIFEHFIFADGHGRTAVSAMKMAFRHWSEQYVC
jgi:hypothetical protein